MNAKSHLVHLPDLVLVPSLGLHLFDLLLLHVGLLPVAQLLFAASPHHTCGTISMNSVEREVLEAEGAAGNNRVEQLF